jgi:transcriptional regulator with XRE-family HTH domain
MDANQYRRALKKLGLTQQAAADFLGISLRTSQAYALGEKEVVPESIAKLFRLMIKLRLRPEDMR